MTTTTATKRVPGVGSRAPSRLPEADLIADPALAELLDDYARLSGERRKAERAVIAARDGGPQARKQDADDQGAALRDGRADPGPAHEKQRMADLEASRSRIASLDAARLQLAREIQLRRLEVRDRLVAGLDAHRAEVGERVADALDVLRVAVTELKREQQLRAWVEPATLDVYSPPRDRVGDPVVQLPGGGGLEVGDIVNRLASTLGV